MAKGAPNVPADGWNNHSIIQQLLRRWRLWFAHYPRQAENSGNTLQKHIAQNLPKKEIPHDSFDAWRYLFRRPWPSQKGRIFEIWICRGRENLFVNACLKHINIAINTITMGWDSHHIPLAATNLPRFVLGSCSMTAVQVSEAWETCSGWKMVVSGHQKFPVSKDRVRSAMIRSYSEKCCGCLFSPHLKGAKRLPWKKITRQLLRRWGPAFDVAVIGQNLRSVGPRDPKG